MGQPIQPHWSPRAETSAGGQIRCGTDASEAEDAGQAEETGHEDQGVGQSAPGQKSSSIARSNGHGHSAGKTDWALVVSAAAVRRAAR